MKKENIKNELDALNASFLSKHKENGFTVSNNYFETSKAAILKKTQAEIKQGRGRSVSFAPFFKVAVAAALVGALFIVFKPDTPENTEISEAALIEYIDENYTDFDEEYLAYLLDDEEVENIMKDEFTDEFLEDYLLNNYDFDEEDFL